MLALQQRQRPLRLSLFCLAKKRPESREISTLESLRAQAAMTEGSVAGTTADFGFVSGRTQRSWRRALACPGEKRQQKSTCVPCKKDLLDVVHAVEPSKGSGKRSEFALEYDWCLVGRSKQDTGMRCVALLDKKIFISRLDRNRRSEL